MTTEKFFSKKKRLKGIGISITDNLTAGRMIQLKMKRINLALIMCCQLMEEKSTKAVPIQNQNYFMDK